MTPTLNKLLGTLAGLSVGVFLGSTLPTVHAQWGTHDQDRDRARLHHGPDWNHGRSDDSVWIVNRDKGTVTVFDADTGEVLTDAPVLVGLTDKSGTHDLVVSKRLRKAFIVNETEKTVSVRSASTLELIDTIPIDDTRPHHIELSPDGKTAYVGLFATNRIAAIDGRTHHVDYYTTSQGSQTPLPLAHAPRPSPDGRLIFVPHEVGNLVTKLSARTGQFLASVSPGKTAAGAPSEVLPTRDGETLYVSMRDEGTIKTIDVDTFTVTGDVWVGGPGSQPESLILTPDERILIVSLRGSPARLAFVNTRHMRLITTIDIAGQGTFGDLAVGSPDGRYVYATFDATATGQGGVVKFDLWRRTLDTWLYPTTGRPHGIYYSTIKFREQ